MHKFSLISVRIFKKRNVAWLKKDGKGDQTRMNALLREVMGKKAASTILR